jgi:hypothetical protein
MNWSVTLIFILFLNCANAGEIVIDAPPAEKLRIVQLLKETAKTKVGFTMLEEIYKTKHVLIIRHEPHALGSAGRTFLEMSSNLSNGIGASALIEMHFGIPDTGSHLVLECSAKNEETTSFTLLMNFIHELRHARDGMTGKFLGHRSEKDAVESENLLRKELSISDQRCLRDDEDHVWQIWFDQTSPQ